MTGFLKKFMDMIHIKYGILIGQIIVSDVTDLIRSVSDLPSSIFHPLLFSSQRDGKNDSLLGVAPPLFLIQNAAS